MSDELKAELAEANQKIATLEAELKAVRESYHKVCSIRCDYNRRKARRLAARSAA